MSAWVKIQVCVPGTKAPQVVAMRPTTTLEEAVEIIAEKYGADECKGKQLAIAPKSKKEGGQVFGKTAVVSHVGVTEKDVMELWHDPRMLRVSAHDSKEPRLIAIDCGCLFKEMIPLLQNLFFKKTKGDIAVLCTIDQKKSFWLSCNSSLKAQDVGHESHLVLYPLPSILTLGFQYFSPPQKQGYLSLTELPKNLRGSSMRARPAKKYWFVFKQPLLVYWKNEKKASKSAAKGALSLDRFTIRRVDNRGPVYPYLLHKWPLATDPAERAKEEESYYIAAESNGEMKGWIDVLQPLCINSEIKRVFGVPISTLTLRNNGDPIPPILRKTTKYITEKGLDVEGIFRVCGSSNDIEAYKQRFDDGEDVNMDSCPDVHVVCGLYKLFLREMPEPILTFELYDCFCVAHANIKNFTSDPTVLASKMVELLSGLPAENYQVLKYVLKFLSLVEQHSSNNLMSLENLATVFGPNLLRQSNEEQVDVLRDTTAISEICETLISQQRLIFDRVVESKERTLRLSRQRTERKEAGGVLVDSGEIKIAPSLQTKSSDESLSFFAHLSGGAATTVTSPRTAEPIPALKTKNSSESLNFFAHLSGGAALVSPRGTGEEATPSSPPSSPEPNLPQALIKRPSNLRRKSKLTKKGEVKKKKQSGEGGKKKKTEGKQKKQEEDKINEETKQAEPDPSPKCEEKENGNEKEALTEFG